VIRFPTGKLTPKKVSRMIAKCEACETTLRIKRLRGKWGAPVLFVMSSPSRKDCTKWKSPLCDQPGSLFHLILEDVGFDTAKDCVVCCLANCYQEKVKIAPRIVTACSDIFEAVYRRHKPKIVVALGTEVAKHLLGGSVPATIQGRYINWRGNYLFAFSDPAMIQEDLEATNFSGKPQPTLTGKSASQRKLTRS